MNVPGLVAVEAEKEKPLRTRDVFDCGHSLSSLHQEFTVIIARLRKTNATTQNVLASKAPSMAIWTCLAVFTLF